MTLTSRHFAAVPTCRPHRRGDLGDPSALVGSLRPRLGDPGAVGGLTGLRNAMHIHRMVRTQLYLDEAIHARLRNLSRQQGRTIPELVREALVRAYGTTDAQAPQAAVMAVLGLWKGRDDIGGTRGYVRRLRRGTRRRQRLQL